MSEPTEDIDGRLVLVPSGKRFPSKGQELPFTIEEKVFFLRKVIEDRHGGDVGSLRDLRDRYIVEASLDKKTGRRVGYGRSCFLLLSFTEAGGVHVLIILTIML